MGGLWSPWLGEFGDYHHRETSARTGHRLPIVPMVPIVPHSAPMVSVADASVKLYQLQPILGVLSLIQRLIL